MASSIISLEKRGVVVKLHRLFVKSKDVISPQGMLLTIPKLKASVLADVKLQFHGANKGVNIEFGTWSLRLNRCSF